ANIEGVGAASRILFRKEPTHLTVDEIARLVNVPQNPTAYNEAAAPAIAQLPFTAPPFVKPGPQASPTPRTPRIRLTLQRQMQSLLEGKLKAYVEPRRNLGVNNAAAMVIDSESMEVLALVGSKDFFDVAIGGQINGTTVRRSPGSALKPLLYALAL